MDIDSFLQSSIEIKEESISSSSYLDPENEAPTSNIIAHATRSKNKYCSKKNFGRMTHEQLQCFIEFSQEHPDLLAGKWLHVKSLWDELANQLNSYRGPQRTARKWKETLSHRKNQLRCRARREKRSSKENDPEQSDLSSMKIDQEAPTAPLTLPSAIDNSFQTITTPSPAKGKQTRKAKKAGASEKPAAAHEDELNALGLENNDTPNSTFESTPAEPKHSLQESPSPRSTAARQVSPETPSSLNTEKMSIQKIFKLTLESIKARDERDERMLAQQAQLTDALEKLTQAVVKLSEKLDKIP